MPTSVGVIISLALVLYSIGVWAERIAGRLKPWHLAIILILVHAVWATVVLVRKDEAWITKFHRFSVVVGVIWLIPRAFSCAQRVSDSRALWGPLPTPAHRRVARRERCD